MKYDYDTLYERKLHELASKSQRILDVGGGRPLQKRLSEYQELLKEKEYLTLDIDASTKPDMVGDAHMMPFPDGAFDAVLHNSVLEHLHSPWTAAQEMHRVLRPGGVMLGIVPWVYPYHAKKGHYEDYWRFSRDGLRRLYSDFAHVEVYKTCRWWQTMGFFLPGYHRVRSALEPVLYSLDRMVSPRRSTTGFHIIWASK